MELLIAILIALGSLSSPNAYTAEYELQYQSDIEKASHIIYSGQYSSQDGGVIINQDIDG